MTEHATYKELRRSRSDRMVGGVCGGLGRYFDVNPMFYRVGFVVLAVLGGAGLLIYGAAVLVIPDEDSDESIVEEALREHRDRPWRLVGLGLVSIAALALLSHARLWPHGDVAWVLLFFAGLALLSSRRRHPWSLRWWDTSKTTGATETTGTTEATAVTVSLPPQPRRRRLPVTTITLGVLAVAAGILGALDHWGVHVSWAVALAVAAVAVGLALIAGAFLQFRVGGLAFLGLLLAIAAICASTIDVHLNDGIGSRNFNPISAAGLRHDYRLGIGNLQLDLSNLSLPAGKTRIDARLGIGELRVTVPRGAKVVVTSHVDWGDSEVLGDDQNGHAVNQTIARLTGTSNRTLVLNTHVGAGHLEVVRAYG